jgi:MFS family permease
VVKVSRSRQLGQPIGYLLGMVLALMVAPRLVWRNVFFIAGGLGLLIAVLTYSCVKQRPRAGPNPSLPGSRR